MPRIVENIFSDREDAAQQLAEKLKHIELRNALVLGIPRGGVLTGAILASELNALPDRRLDCRPGTISVQSEFRRIGSGNLPYWVDFPGDNLL